MSDLMVWVSRRLLTEKWCMPLPTNPKVYQVSPYASFNQSGTRVQNFTFLWCSMRHGTTPPAKFIVLAFSENSLKDSLLIHFWQEENSVSVIWLLEGDTLRSAPYPRVRKHSLCFLPLSNPTSLKPILWNNNVLCEDDVFKVCVPRKLQHLHWMNTKTGNLKIYRITK